MTRGDVARLICSAALTVWAATDLALHPGDTGYLVLLVMVGFLFGGQAIYWLFRKVPRA